MILKVESYFTIYRMTPIKLMNNLILRGAKMRVYELQPNDSRKSFYGKALIINFDNGSKALQSYQTIVAIETPDGKLHRTWDGWSATTGRHIRAFAGINKSEWDELEVEKLNNYC